MIGTVRVDAVFIGKALPRWPGRPPSGIGKVRTAERLRLTLTGLVGDEQADLAVHGGPEKAMHHYAADNYAFWKKQLPQKAGCFVAGGFGENISASGLTEKDICIGDVFRIGGAVVQVTQGRQPCWKLSAHISLVDMAARFQKSGLTGWYYRVIEEGFIEEGDCIALLERPQPDWPLTTVIAARFSPALAPEMARQLAGIEQMSRSWHAAFLKKSDPSYREDTTARVLGK
jgi:MOSC domain-containing protein YiiM